MHPKFYIGCPVKKVRGKHNIGMTAVVSCLDPFMVKCDTAWISLVGQKWDAGTHAYTDPGLWEPILYTPAIEEILEMDKTPDRDADCPLFDFVHKEEK